MVEGRRRHIALDLGRVKGFGREEKGTKKRVSVGKGGFALVRLSVQPLAARRKSEGRNPPGPDSSQSTMGDIAPLFCPPQISHYS